MIDRALRRDLIAGEAPVLLDEDQVCALLDVTAAQLRHRDIEPMTMAGAVQFYRASEARRIMLGTPRQKPKKTLVNSTTYRPPLFAVPGSIGGKPPGPLSEYPEHLSAISDAISAARAAGARTIAEIADALNEAGVPSPAGGHWHLRNTARLIDRLAEAAA